MGVDIEMLFTHKVKFDAELYTENAAIEIGSLLNTFQAISKKSVVYFSGLIW